MNTFVCSASGSRCDVRYTLRVFLMLTPAYNLDSYQFKIIKPNWISAFEKLKLFKVALLKYLLSVINVIVVARQPEHNLLLQKIVK